MAELNEAVPKIIVGIAFFYSRLQNSVSFAAAKQFFGLTPCKTAVFKGSSYKTEVLQEPLYIKFFQKTFKIG